MNSILLTYYIYQHLNWFIFSGYFFLFNIIMKYLLTYLTTYTVSYIYTKFPVFLYEIVFNECNICGHCLWSLIIFLSHFHIWIIILPIKFVDWVLKNLNVFLLCSFFFSVSFSFVKLFAFFHWTSNICLGY